MSDIKDYKREDGKDVKCINLEIDSRPITLVSNDNKKFTTKRGFAFISTLIKTSLEGNDKVDELKLPSISGDILEFVVRYFEEHKGVEPPIVEKPLRSKNMKDVCAHKPDADYVDKIGENREQLYDLILGANYLDIKSLLHLCCAKVASLVKGEPFENIKGILSVNNKTNEKQDEKNEQKK